MQHVCVVGVQGSEKFLHFRNDFHCEMLVLLQHFTLVGTAALRGCRTYVSCEKLLIALFRMLFYTTMVLRKCLKLLYSYAMPVACAILRAPLRRVSRHKRKCK